MNSVQYTNSKVVFTAHPVDVITDSSCGHQEMTAVTVRMAKGRW